jgi:hypothetical protein
METTMRKNVGQRYAYGWVTLAFFLLTVLGHWTFGWLAFVQEQQAHQQPVEVRPFAIQMVRATLENWQSEFLQLLWQVGGLAILLYVGSPQSRESETRQEAKLDAILRAVDPKAGAKTISRLDRLHDRS